MDKANAIKTFRRQTGSLAVCHQTSSRNRHATETDDAEEDKCTSASRSAVGSNNMLVTYWSVDFTLLFEYPLIFGG